MDWSQVIVDFWFLFSFVNLTSHHLRQNTEMMFACVCVLYLGYVEVKIYH